MVAHLLLACPDCLTGRAARELALSDDLVFHVVAALLPFAVTGAVIGWVARRAGGRS